MRRTKVIYEEPSAEPKKRRRKPAESPEAREKQCIALAFDLVEKRLREGTATSQETTHFLKLGSKYTELELEILKSKKEKLDAEVEAIQSAKRTEELYANALRAMSIYRGNDSDDSFAED